MGTRDIGHRFDFVQILVFRTTISTRQELYRSLCSTTINLVKMIKVAELAAASQYSVAFGGVLPSLRLSSLESLVYSAMDVFVTSVRFQKHVADPERSTIAGGQFGSNGVID